MASSAILKINLLGSTQTNKYQTVNDAISALEQAANLRFTNADANGADITISEAEFTRNVSYNFTGATGNKSIKFPSTINSVNTTRTFLVNNGTSFTLTIKATTGSGTTVVLLPGRSAFIYQGHEDMVQLSLFDTTVGVGPCDLSAFIPGTPPDGLVILKYAVGRPFKLLATLPGSVFAVGTIASSDSTFTLKKNGSSIGTVVFHSSGSPTVTFASDVSFASGDILDVFAPTPADATLADVSFTFLGARL